MKSFAYRGFHRYFLTFCTFGRRSYFVDPGAVRLVHAQILRAGAKNACAITAYCYMPDHVHLLIEGESLDADGRRFIVQAKQLSGFHYTTAFGQTLWQHYAYERVLRREDQTLVVARYILENPVRTGLVSSAEVYPFLGSEKYRVRDILEAVGYRDMPG